PGPAYTDNYFARLRFRAIIVLLHILQPLARLRGRLEFHLTPWRRFGPATASMPVNRYVNVWCDKWVSPEVRLELLEKKLKCQHQYIWRGGDFDHWDLKMKGGEFGMATICMAAEDHKQGHQYLRFRIKPVFARRSRFIIGISLVALVLVILDRAWIPTIV